MGQNSWPYTSYDRDMPTHSNEETDHRWVCTTPGVTPPPFSVFNNVDPYPTCLHDVCFHRMEIDGNALEVLKRLGQSRNTSVAGWTKQWNHCGGRCALEFCCAGKEKDLLIV